VEYQAHVIASNDFEDIEDQLNAFLKRTRPQRIHTVHIVADGLEFTYLVLVLYQARLTKAVT
jgi:hypothetical protein